MVNATAYGILIFYGLLAIIGATIGNHFCKKNGSMWSKHIQRFFLLMVPLHIEQRLVWMQAWVKEPMRQA